MEELAQSVGNESGANEVIRGFNRDSERLAKLVLGAAVSAALLLAVVVQDHRPKSVGLTEESMQPGDDLSLNANSVALVKDVVFQGKKSTGEVTTGQVRSVDHAFNENSPMENPSSQVDAAASTATPILAFTPEINQINSQANARLWWPAHDKDTARVMAPKIRKVRYRSSAVLRPVDVKMRLIALWHQSLARSEKTRSRTAFSKKAAYPVETNH